MVNWMHEMAVVARSGPGAVVRRIRAHLEEEAVSYPKHGFWGFLAGYVLNESYDSEEVANARTDQTRIFLARTFQKVAPVASAGFAVATAKVVQEGINLFAPGQGTEWAGSLVAVACGTHAFFAGIRAYDRMVDRIHARLGVIPD